MVENRYHMTISLNILNHLGINLYSNIPAVLSEVVANSWDADAENVDIKIDLEQKKVIITDDGKGMNEDDINDKYLFIGYEKREYEGRNSPKFDRPYMGRKGIGKLSLFSIANIIEIHSMKNGVKNGLILNGYEIERKIKEEAERKKIGSDLKPSDGDKKEKSSAIQELSYFYEPSPVDEKDIELTRNGTRIIIKDLKKDIANLKGALKKRLARRFSIIGEEHHFNVIVDKERIKVTDRDYYHKIQYLWYFGDDSSIYRQYCKSDKLKADFPRPNTIEDTTYTLKGWIGTVEKSGELNEVNENINKIIIMVRGKLAQEDILEDFPEGGLYTKYLFGEIHADFLDDDDEDDIATSSRQEIKKDDARYIALKSWISVELKNIQNIWTDLRNKEGKKEALKIPAIESWYRELNPTRRKQAEKMFGKINQLTLDFEDKKALFKHSVLAFESLKYKDQLDTLDNIPPENIQAFTTAFTDLDDYEATLYYQIVKERIRALETLREKAEDDALEKVIQVHLYNHLWLLDPSWDRATETVYMEQHVSQEFDKITAKLSTEEKLARYDIKYKKPSGKHVIIELKRAGRSVNSLDLAKQVLKYKKALKGILKESGESQPIIEIICLIGKKCTDWNDEEAENESRNSLSSLDIRVVFYQKLIEDAYNQYKDYLEKKEETGRLSRLIDTIDLELEATQ